MKKTTRAFNRFNSPSSGRLERLIEQLSAIGNDVIKDQFIVSTHLIDVTDELRSFCKLSGIRISYCGYMETCFKGEKEALIKLSGYFPEKNMVIRML